MNKKLYLLLIAILISQTFSYITRELYEEIKSKASFEVLDYEEIKEIFGDRTYADFSLWRSDNFLLKDEFTESLKEENTKTFLQSEYSLGDSALPTNFDWRVVKPDCFTPVKDQKYCGSCYAFAVTGTLESRYCIKSEGKVKPELSQQDIISCDSYNKKCKGDPLYNTWRFLENVGTVDLFCKPYESLYGTVPECINECAAKGMAFKRWKTAPKTWRLFSGVEKIKNEIYQNGPVSATMNTYEDLSAYKSGVYIHTTGRKTDSHAITVVGWGFDETVKKNYWIIRNSWGPTWGDKGYFKAVMDFFEIENSANAALPLL